MSGCELELEDAIRITRERYPDSSFCVVSEWIWLDLEAPDLVIERLAARTLQAKLPNLPVTTWILTFLREFGSSKSFKHRHRAEPQPNL